MSSSLSSRAAAALLLVAAGAGVAAAQPAPDVVAAAHVVVHGEIISLRSAWDADTTTIVTYVGVRVVERLRGAAVPDRLVLEQLGGEVDGIGLYIADQARFTVGERALLLLAASPRDGSLHTVGLGRGKLAATPAMVQAAHAALARTPAPAGRYVAVPPAAAGGDLAAPAYTTLPTDGGYPARWHEVDDGGIVYVVHPTSLPGTWTGSTANATAAINLWRNSGMELDLRDGGATFSTSACAAAFTGNGRISVSYNDPCGVAEDADKWVVGGGYYTTGDLRTVGGTTYQKFIQGFVVLNNTGPAGSAASCFQDAITHGLGHALGLGHSDSSGAIMNPLPTAGCASSPPRGLGADDVTGVTTIYRGIASGPFPPNAPTALTASVVLNTVTFSWTPASTGGAAARYVIEAGTASGIYNIGAFTFNGPATSAAFDNVPTGTYFVRVRAQNAAGTSGPSPEAQATVGACSPPGMPGTLTSSVTDQSVLLQWSAPATGVAQTYRFSVGTAPGVTNLLVADYPASVTAIAANSVPYGAFYARVQAMNVCGVSPPSNEVTVVVQPCAAPPQAPTNLTFARSGTFVAMQWAAPAAGPRPSSYVLAVGSQPGASNVLVYPTGSTATSLGAPAPPGTYYARILAQNACGLSGASNEIVVVVP